MKYDSEKRQSARKLALSRPDGTVRAILTCSGTKSKTVLCQTNPRQLRPLGELMEVVPLLESVVVGLVGTRLRQDRKKGGLIRRVLVEWERFGML